MNAWARRLCVCAAMVLVIIDGLAVGAAMKHLVVGYLGVPMVTLVLILVVLGYTRYAQIRPFRTKPGEFKAVEVPGKSAYTLLNIAEQDRRLDAIQIKTLALAITEPAALRQRLVEDYEPDRRTLRQTVSMQVRLPKQMLPRATGGTPGTTTIYFPLLLAEKGELHDEFDAFVDGDKPAQVLSYREYLGLVTSVLHGLLLTAYRKRAGDSLPKEARDAEILAVSGMMRRKRSQDAGHLVDFSGAEAIEQLTACVTGTRDLAAKFVRKLTTHYAVIATVETDKMGRFSIKYRRTLIPDVKLSDPGTERRLTFRGWLRQALGAKPVQVAIELDNASTCQSYHLRINGPAGMYLAAQIPTDLESITGRIAKGAPTAPYCRFRRRLGQSHAHFYARYFPEILDGERPRIEFRYFETPPGSVFRAAVTAGACLALVWLTGWLNLLAADPGSDLPALLLAFPALAATWLGFEAPSGRLFEGTLSSRFCLLATAVLSIGASGLFMLHFIVSKEHPHHAWSPLPAGMSVFGITDLGWAILIMLALINFVHIGYKAYIATWRYAYLASRLDVSTSP